MKYNFFLLYILSSILISCNTSWNGETVPFQYIKNQIIITARIGNDGPFNFLLDTGVDPSAIDFKTATAFEIPIDMSQSGSAEGRGNDKVVVFPASIKDLKVGKKNYGTIEALTLNLKRLGNPLGLKLHGILGYSFLKDKIIRVNYQKQNLQIFNSDNDLNKIVSQKAYTSEFITDGEDMIPIVTHFVMNGKTFKASIDTGSSLNIQVYMHCREHFQIALDTLESSQIIGARGKKKIYKSMVRNFSIGEFNFKNDTISISTIKNENQLRMGNVGNKFLENFIVTFDFINDNIIFESN